MKRCPDCGFRTKVNERLCPLCGVRMRDDPGGNTVHIQTHVHTQPSEVCTVDFDQPKASVHKPQEQAQYRPVVQERKRSSGSAENKLGKAAVSILVVVFFALLRACMGN